MDTAAALAFGAAAPDDCPTIAAVPDRRPTSTMTEMIGSSAAAAFKNLMCEIMPLPYCRESLTMSNRQTLRFDFVRAPLRDFATTFCARTRFTCICGCFRALHHAPVDDDKQQKLNS